MYDAVLTVNAGLNEGRSTALREVRNELRSQNLLAWGFEGFVRLARTAWLLLENALATFFTKNGNSLLLLNGYSLGQTPASYYDLTRGLPGRPSGPCSSHVPYEAPCQQVLAAEPVSHLAYAPPNAPLQASVHSRNRIVQQIPLSQSYFGSGRTSYRKTVKPRSRAAAHDLGTFSSPRARAHQIVITPPRPPKIGL